MTEYRLYCLDGMGKIESAGVIAAKDDAQAVFRAMEMNSVSCEIWKRGHLVARTPAAPLRA